MAAKLYRAALLLYPPSFRREFAAEMARDFQEATQDTRQAGGRGDVLALWARLGADLARTAALQWLRTGLPIVVIGSMAAAIAATRVAANMLLHEPIPVPATAHDRDLLTLMLMTATVLLVIVATIVFTFWFCRPVTRRRHR